MKQIIRKILSVTLVICMTLGLATFSSFASPSGPYTVTYYGDAGDVTGVPPAQTKTHDASLTLSAAIPTRPGFIFIGWGTTTGATSPAYYPGNTYSDNRNLDLFAVWNSSPPYQITFNVNGGDPLYQSTAMTAIDGRLSSLPRPTKANSTFIGWFTTPTTGGSEVTSNTVFDKNTIIYARWSGRYQITFDANGGYPYTYTLWTDANGRLTGLPDPAPERTGYVLDGWFRDRTGGTAITTGANGTVFTEDTTLYAQWAEGFTITFNLNYTNAPTPSTRTTAPNGRLATTSMPNNPTRTGFVFVGWFNTPAATGGTQLLPNVSGGFYQFYDSTIVYARWATGYTITFNSNGGNALNPGTATTGTNGRLASLPTPTRTGYNFVGWFNTAAVTGGTEIKTDTVYAVNTTIYARWAVGYTITFNVNGGNALTPSTAATAANGRLASLPTPTRTGHTFMGWYTTETGGTEVTVNMTFTQNSTIYARWSQSDSANASVDARLSDITAAANSNNGTSVVVTMASGSTSVSKEILAVMQGKNMKLVLDFGTSGRVTIDGREINYVNSISDLNLALQYSEVTSTAIPGTVRQIKIGTSIVDLRNSSVGVITGAGYAGMNGILCGYNAAAGRYDVVSGGIIDAGGNVTTDFHRTGDYIVVARHTGDVTGTGTVTANDALEVLRAVTGRTIFDPVQSYVANSRRDGTITANDALNILKYVTGQSSSI
ncbi:MAG: InlB B-repeat-containing protein [Oscillospiraceae bacterium]|nr:InlB B-repeat-containing protein [Oscillospiraceae bacterium]